MAWVAQVSGGRPMLAAGSPAGTMRLPPGIILFIIVLKGKNSVFPWGGRGHWSVNYNSTKSLVTILSFWFVQNFGYFY